MSILLITAMLAVQPEETKKVETESSPKTFVEIADHLKKDARTGTLIFSRGSCLAVKIYTQSSYTHVAAIVRQDGQLVAYDAMNGKGVRKLPLKEFLDTQRPDTIHVTHPVHPFSRERKAQFVRHLEEEIGRPYAISHHLTGERAEGLHCSEYVTDALMSSHVIKAENPSRVSPASLARGLFEAELYTPARTFKLLPEKVPTPKGRNRCEQMWIDTKICTVNCFIKLRKWFICR